MHSVAAYDGRRGVREVWPTLLVAGSSFAIPQFLMSNLPARRSWTPWIVMSLLVFIGWLRLILATTLLASGKGMVGSQ